MAGGASPGQKKTRRLGLRLPAAVGLGLFLVTGRGLFLVTGLHFSACEKKEAKSVKLVLLPVLCFV